MPTNATTSSQQPQKLTELQPNRRSPEKLTIAKGGFSANISKLHEEIRALYVEDDVPWIIGYSGGKDSTATAQLIWDAIAELPEVQRKKPVYVITTDTLVENPIVASWVRASLKAMGEAARSNNMPFEPQLLVPEVAESFWVNLIGKGYPAPRPKFRWCTERLKIRPSNRFISSVVTTRGEAILCIGARRSESTARARVMKNAAKYRARDRLSPSQTLPGCMIYTPVEQWTSKDIWFYLEKSKNPWGASNKELKALYADASEDGECPVVVDDSTPSCGNSRFGCWVCTLVEEDKSMTAMIRNDIDKEWMLPLLELRNALDFRSGAAAGKHSDHHLRDFRRMTGHVHTMADGTPVPGPYTQEARQDWLKRLLEAQTYVQQHAPPDVPEIELISIAELEEIRRIWVYEKHELEDRLPAIYESETGKPYPGAELDDDISFGPKELDLVAEVCGDDRIHYELVRELLSVTAQQRKSGRRAKLYERLDSTFKRHFYESKEDAVARATARKAAIQKAERTGPSFAGSSVEAAE